MNIILGIISEIFTSIADSYRKKSIDNSKLKKSSFAIIASFFGLIFVSLFSYFIGEKLVIFSSYFAIITVILISITQVITNFLYINVYEKVKISELLPYGNIGSLFTVIVSFIIFYGTENSASIITFLITLLTIFVIIIINFNPKKVKFSKHILLYILALLLDSIVFLTLGYLLLDYSSLNYMTLTILVDFILYGVLILITKESLRLIFNQNKTFYNSRLMSIILGRGGFFIGLYIIETSGVLLATLISFLGIVFSILSMKFILNDNPSKKTNNLSFYNKYYDLSLILL